MCDTVTDSAEVSLSCTPRTVTDCSSCQFEVVNAKLIEGTASAPVSPDDTVTDTGAVGSVARRSVYLAVAPSATLSTLVENTSLGSCSGSTTRLVRHAADEPFSYSRSLYCSASVIAMT